MAGTYVVVLNCTTIFGLRIKRIHTDSLGAYPQETYQDLNLIPFKSKLTYWFSIRLAMDTRSSI
jgi:hypothetical protein